MTPKEKAKELYDKMYALHLTSIQSKFRSIDAAIVCVDEILNNDGFTKFDDYLTEYWQQVKQEIELL